MVELNEKKKILFKLPPRRDREANHVEASQRLPGPLENNPTSLSQDKKYKPRQTSLWRWLLPRAIDVILAILLIFGTVTYLHNDDEHKSIFGYRYYFVKSGSMEPVLPTGSFILVKITKPEDVHVGDNISFFIGKSAGEEPEFWTHSVIEVKHENNNILFQTKGIANRTPDPFVLEGKNVIGKVVFCSKWLGPLMMFASNNPIQIISVVVSLFFLIHVVGIYMRKRKEEQNGHTSQ